MKNQQREISANDKLEWTKTKEHIAKTGTFTEVQTNVNKSFTVETKPLNTNTRLNNQHNLNLKTSCVS